MDLALGKVDEVEVPHHVVRLRVNLNQKLFRDPKIESSAGASQDCHILRFPPPNTSVATNRFA